jgi:hypothetical protein
VTPFVSVFVAAAILIVVITVILFVALSAAAKARDRRYRNDLLDWATTRDWTYRDGGGHVTEFLPEAEWVSLLPKGERRRGVNLQLDGTRQGHRVTVAYYWYQTTHTSTDSNGHHSTDTSTHNLTVIVVWLTASYPAVELRHRGRGLGWGLAVSRAVGRQPANLTGTEEFDRRYQIRTAAPGESALMTPQLISAYLTSDLPPWQLSGDQLVITCPGPIKADGLDQKVDQALTIAGLLDSPATRP